MSDVADHDLRARQDAAARRLAPLIELSVPATAGAAVGALGGVIAAVAIPIAPPTVAFLTLVLTVCGGVGAVALYGRFVHRLTRQPRDN